MKKQTKVCKAKKFTPKKKAVVKIKIKKIPSPIHKNTKADRVNLQAKRITKTFSGKMPMKIM